MRAALSQIKVVWREARHQRVPPALLLGLRHCPRATLLLDSQTGPKDGARMAYKSELFSLTALAKGPVTAAAGSDGSAGALHDPAALGDLVSPEPP